MEICILYLYICYSYTVVEENQLQLFKKKPWPQQLEFDWCIYCTMFCLFIYFLKKRVNSTPQNDIYLTLDIQITLRYLFCIQIVDLQQSIYCSKNKWNSTNETTTQNMQKNLFHRHVVFFWAKVLWYSIVDQNSFAGRSRTWKKLNKLYYFA